ncbi:MAG: IS110 family transposase [Lentilactobacillus diolivorans]
MTEPVNVIYTSCAGLDVHQATVVACLLHGKLTSTRPKKELKTFETTQKGLSQLAEWLTGFDCQVVAMESTGGYWQPIWHVLEDRFPLILANPQRIKGIAGHKTDKVDARWIAGLLRVDLIPSESIRELRDLTRTRKYLVADRNRKKNWVQKILQTAGIKLTTYIADIFGKSGRALLDMLVNGEVLTPATVEKVVFTSLKRKVPLIVEALNGFFNEHHRFMLDQQLKLIDVDEDTIAQYERRIDTYLEMYTAEVELLRSFPGIQKNATAIVLAEVGPDVVTFKDASHLFVDLKFSYKNYFCPSPVFYNHDYYRVETCAKGNFLQCNRITQTFKAKIFG